MDYMYMYHENTTTLVTSYLELAVVAAVARSDWDRAEPLRDEFDQTHPVISSSLSCTQ